MSAHCSVQSCKWAEILGQSPAQKYKPEFDLRLSNRLGPEKT